MTNLATEKLDLDNILLAVNNANVINTKNYKSFYLWQNTAKNTSFSQSQLMVAGNITHVRFFQSQFVTNSVNNALLSTASFEILHADTTFVFPIVIQDVASDQNLAMGETVLDFDLNFPILATDTIVFYGTNKTDIRNFCCIVTVKI